MRFNWLNRFRGYKKYKVTEEPDGTVDVKGAIIVGGEVEEGSIDITGTPFLLAEEEVEGRAVSLLKKITYTCQCCGFTKSFPSEEVAFNTGWDTPYKFPGGPITCSRCPSSHLIVGGTPEGHLLEHKRWRREGHPEVGCVWVVVG